MGSFDNDKLVAGDLELAIELRKALTYDPENGVLRWREPGRGRRKDLVAGSVRVNASGQPVARVVFQGEEFRVSKVAWAIVTGLYPDHCVFHRDNDRTNCRWSNLFIAIPSAARRITMDIDISMRQAL